jgi:hypothetical protein
MQLSLVVAYRSRAWRWPFRDVDSLEVWAGAGAEARKVAEFPASLLLELVRQQLAAAALTLEVRAHVDAEALRLTNLGGPRLLAAQGRHLRGYRAPPR